jgi:hypothetical protein
MKQIQLEPYVPKQIETVVARKEGCGDLPYHQADEGRITYWKCKSILGRLLFLFNGKIELKMEIYGIEDSDRMPPVALCINSPESDF